MPTADDELRDTSSSISHATIYVLIFLPPGPPGVLDSVIDSAVPNALTLRRVDASLSAIRHIAAVLLRSA